jgi:hypothetical protein
MLRQFARAAAWLLLIGLAALAWMEQEIRPALAGLAIAGLAETALALRARRGRPPAGEDRSRLDAVQVSCTEADGALTVALRGAAPAGRGSAPCVLLSRALRPAAPQDALHRDGPRLQLSDRRGSVHGGIQEACLSPQLLCLTPDARGAEALGTSEIRVLLPAGLDQRPLERTLGRILRGVPFTSERSMPADMAGRAES